MKVRNALLYVALRVAGRLLPLVPLGLGYKLADAAGRAAYYAGGSARRNLEANLRLALGDRQDIPELARSAFRNNAQNWLDSLRIEHLRIDDLEKSIHVQNLDELERALAAGHGVILVSLHLGNFDLVGQVLARRFKLTVPVERMQPERLFRFLTAERRSKGINLVASDVAARHMIRALRAGEIVAVMADGKVRGGKVLVDFMNHPAMLTRVPAQLARKMGARVLVGAGVRRPDGGFDGIMHPVALSYSGRADEDDRENTERIAAGLADIIRQYPGQWMAFTPVWDIPSERAATIGHRTGATI